MENKKILLLCQHFYPEMVSTGLHMTELGTYLVRLGHKVSVFCAKPQKERTEDESANVNNYKGVEITRCDSNFEQEGSVFKRLKAYINYTLSAFRYAVKQRKEYDVLLITTNPPFIAFIAYLIRLFYKKDYVIIGYDIYPDVATKLNVMKENGMSAKGMNFMNKKAFHGASAVVSIGEDMSEILRNKYPKMKKLELIHNWSNREDVKQVTGENIFVNKYGFHGKKILLYSGNFGRTHNVEVILEAAKEMQDLEDVLFVFIGSGYKKKIISGFIAQHQLKNVQLLEYQPFEILHHVLSSCVASFVVLDNDFTGLSVPSKAYGIMAVGRPLVGVLDRKSEIYKTIEKYDCGVVYDPRTDTGFADRLRAFLRDDERQLVAGQNALKAFEENFDLRISAQKYSRLINAI